MSDQTVTVRADEEFYFNMREVYDAAMALHEAGIDKMCFVFADDSDKYDNLRLELIAACRRAKEGR